jgi:ribonuclease HI
VKNGWMSASKQPVKNKELIRYISALIDLRYHHGQNVHLQYVKGHSGDEGNDGADQLAVNGCLMPEVPERDWNAAREAIENLPSDIERTEFVEAGLEDINLLVSPF